MRRLPCGRLGPLFLAGLVVTLLPAVGRSDPPKAQPILFDTFDKVELKGSWYPSAAEGKKSPVVVLLHKIGGNREQKGWQSLAQQLQDKGFAVLSFDFRGHGDSKSVKPEFWNVPHNLRGIKGASPKKDSIDHTQFLPSYSSMLVNDLAAVKVELERRNNAGECNTNNVYVVGGEDGASLGLVWMATEWKRHKKMPNPTNPFQVIFKNDPEALDLAGMVCLSVRPALGPSTGQRLPTTIFSEQKFREMPICFFAGGDEKESSSFTTTLCDKVLYAEKQKLTFRFEVPKAKLAGHELLDKRAYRVTKGKLEDTEASVEEVIVQYLDKIRSTRAAKAWGERDVPQEGRLNINPLVLIPLSNFGLSYP